MVAARSSRGDALFHLAMVGCVLVGGAFAGNAGDWLWQSSNRGVRCFGPLHDASGCGDSPVCHGLWQSGKERCTGNTSCARRHRLCGLLSQKLFADVERRAAEQRSARQVPSPATRQQDVAEPGSQQRQQQQQQQQAPLPPPPASFRQPEPPAASPPQLQTGMRASPSVPHASGERPGHPASPSVLPPAAPPSPRLPPPPPQQQQAASATTQLPLRMASALTQSPSPPPPSTLPTSTHLNADAGPAAAGEAAAALLPAAAQLSLPSLQQQHERQAAASTLPEPQQDRQGAVPLPQVQQRPDLRQGSP